MNDTKLIHIYTMGRFGPEKLIGFVWGRMSVIPFKDNSSHIGWDVVKSRDIPSNFYRNPLGIGNLMDFRKWQYEAANA